jgi:peptide deformylase
MQYDIRIYGDPVLREKARRIERVDDDLRKLAADMIETMRAREGVGLAAQQIGETRAICVVEVPENYDKDPNGERMNPGVAMPMILINPEIGEPSDDTDLHEEGCLSFPEIRANIVRPFSISLRYTDEQGQVRTLQPRGFLARVIQHEVDHLNGVLFIDRMSAPKRFAIKGKLRKMKEETEDRLAARRA